MDPKDHNPRAAAFIKEETAELLEIIQRKDDLVSDTLRFYLVIESHLERIIVSLLPRGKRLIRNGRMTFAQILRVVESLISEDRPVFSSLYHLNQLRNKCAHDRNKVVSREDLTKIGEPMGAEYVEIRHLYSEEIDKFAVAIFGCVFGSLSAVIFHAENRNAQ